MPSIATRQNNTRRANAKLPQTLAVSITAYNTPSVGLDSTVRGGRSTTRTVVVPVDPAYIEIKNYEANAKLQLINPSLKPDASFAKDALALDIDHIVPNADGSLTAVVILDPAEMQASSMRPGDLVRLRQVAADGKASKPTALIYVDPDLMKLPDAEVVDRELHRDSFSLGTLVATTRSRNSSGRLVDTTTTTSGRRQVDTMRFNAHTVRFGVATRNGVLPAAEEYDVACEAQNLYSAQRRNVSEEIIELRKQALTDLTSQYASQAKDKSEPTLVTERMTLENNAGKFTLKLDRAIEPRTQLTVVNIRTKEKVSVAVGDETSAELKLPAGTLAGDDIAILVEGDRARNHTSERANLNAELFRVSDRGLDGMTWDEHKNASHFYGLLVDQLSLPSL